MAPRRTHDSSTLLMLPAPLAHDRRSSASRSSEDNSDASGSNLRLVPSPHTSEQYTDYDSPASPGTRYESPAPRTASSAGATVPFLEGQTNRDPFFATSPTSYEEPMYSHDSADSAGGYRAGGRGVRLMDSGPVPGPDGVRRVSRQSGRRASSQNRYSRNSAVFSLPPGAAAPQPYNGN